MNVTCQQLLLRARQTTKRPLLSPVYFSTVIYLCSKIMEVTSKCSIIAVVIGFFLIFSVLYFVMQACQIEKFLSLSPSRPIGRICARHLCHLLPLRASVVGSALNYAAATLVTCLLIVKMCRFVCSTAAAAQPKKERELHFWGSSFRTTPAPDDCCRRCKTRPGPWQWPVNPSGVKRGRGEEMRLQLPRRGAAETAAAAHASHSADDWTRTRPRGGEGIDERPDRLGDPPRRGLLRGDKPTSSRLDARRQPKY
jgi:hypothetical protein